MVNGFGEVADMNTGKAIGLLRAADIFTFQAGGNAKAMAGNGEKVTGDKIILKGFTSRL